ncbi:hypothetical protein [Cellulosimicrobium sp. Marseille-Q4280]|uniref:hypothetical protein n=1 Tax=Cellulosimicrobium sp. Marseille-Q4280 TaxID=2937992 RepID=UPI00203B010F|nr:hypothetical protein [Cellulosimicrobium sp. Marseille-Q4280]
MTTARVPAGVRTGGQFTAGARAEAPVDLGSLRDALDAEDLGAAREILEKVMGRFEHLTGPELAADDALRSSWLEATALANRVRETFQRVEDTARAASAAAALVRGGQVADAGQAFDARRAAAAATEDLADIESLMSTTVLGVAKARATLSDRELLVRAQADDSAPAKMHQASLALTEAEAASPEGFQAARGTLDRSHPDYHLWSGVVPVAVEVDDVDGPSLLRVAIIEPRNNTMLGRVTLPARRVRDASGRLDMAAVAGTVRWMASHESQITSVEDSSRAAACARLLEDMNRTIPPF